MNIEMLLQVAADAIQDQYPAQPQRYTLYIHDHQLCCSPQTYTPAGVTNVINLTSLDINNGVTASKWWRINTTLRKFHKEGLI